MGMIKRRKMHAGEEEEEEEGAQRGDKIKNSCEKSRKCKST